MTQLMALFQKGIENIMGRGGYQQDAVDIINRQSNLIKQQVLLEIITIACNCDDFTQFKKVLWARALGFMKQMEDEGIIKKGSTEKAAKGEDVGDNAFIGKAKK